MGPEGLLVLLILFEEGYHVSILGSHSVSWRGFKGTGRRVVQGQGQCGGFKGKANAEGGSKANARAIEKKREIKLSRARRRRRLRQHLLGIYFTHVWISEAKNKGKERVPLRGFNWEVKTNYDSQPPWSHDHGNFQQMKRYMNKVLQRASALTKWIISSGNGKVNTLTN